MLILRYPFVVLNGDRLFLLPQIELFIGYFYQYFVSGTPTGNALKNNGLSSVAHSTTKNRGGFL